MKDFDVIVVGSGPAGAFSAIKCSQLGFNVLLIERGTRWHHKPCGGILTPICLETIEKTTKKTIPKEVMCSPETLELYYVPPSGRKNGGCIKNYRVFNINRDKFDYWLRELVEGLGIQVWYEAELLGLQKLEPIQASVKKNNSNIALTAQYLIGADGVYSKVRSKLYDKVEVETVTILQEYCKCEGDFDNYFYEFFRGEISPTYSYLIPKDGLYVLGVGIPTGCSTSISACMSRFKDQLQREFTFKIRSVGRRENWAIPYGFTYLGEGNVVLAGDAAGFCNAFSGEGIRLAVESGIAAGQAVQEAITENKPLASPYIDLVEWISDLVRRTYEFSIDLTDEEREEFVRSELARVSLSNY